MSDVILDASALLALLQDEPGAAEVMKVVDRAAMSAVNHAEIYTHYARLGLSRDMIADMLRSLPIEVVPADAALAAEAGMLRSVTSGAGLSLGDRFCLALAKREGLSAWTADQAWRQIADAAGVDVYLIR